MLKTTMFKKSLLTLAITLSTISAAHAADTVPTQAELWKIVQSQQAELAELKAQLNKTSDKVKVTEQNLSETDQKVTATADAVDLVKAKESSDKTFIGGYGELHINQLNNELATGKDLKEIDFHRFVLLLGHEFSDTVRVFSEFELEHTVAGEGKKGEVEIEQAYVEWDFAANHSLRSGVFLVPVGILNETHEPDTFYGVERNNIEKNIIPTTWWEAGVQFKGELAEGWSYDAAMHSGLNLATGKFKIRDGRQKVSSAPAEDFAYTGRLKYNGIAGLEVAATIQHQDDLWQGLGASKLDATLVETHINYQVGSVGLRALYAQWDIDKAINTVSKGAEEQSGWYIEPSYKFNASFGVFISYGEWDNQAAGTVDTKYGEWTLGGNYWLTDTTVFKVDLLRQESPTGKDEYHGFNLGVGYSF
jgi:hypothetical protein